MSSLLLCSVKNDGPRRRKSSEVLGARRSLEPDPIVSDSRLESPGSNAEFNFVKIYLFYRIDKFFRLGVRFYLHGSDRSGMVGRRPTARVQELSPAGKEVHPATIILFTRLAAPSVSDVPVGNDPQ